MNSSGIPRLIVQRTMPTMHKDGGIFLGFGSKETMGNVYAAVSGYRFCAGVATDYMSSWFAEVLQSCPEADLPSVELLHSLWCALGASPDLVEELSLHIRLVWRDSQLWVCEGFMKEQDWVNRLSTALSSLWCFTSFSTSRWLTLGDSCRCMLRGLMSGFPSLISHMQSSGVSQYYSAGCSKISSAEWQFIAAVGLSSYLPEAVLATVVVDPRVPRLLDDLIADCAREFDYMECLEAAVWSLIGSALDIGYVALRSRVLSSMIVSWGFLWMRTFEPASGWPWWMCSGNILENLEQVGAMTTPPSDPVGHKVWLLLQAGMNPVTLSEPVQMLGECVWTSVLAEKMHTGVAVIKKFHPEIQVNTLAARAYLHMSRRMIAEETPEEKSRQRWMHKWVRLQRACPQKVSGRHIFLKEAMQRATSTEKKKLVLGKPYDRRKIMRIHGREWSKLGSDAKKRYHQLAVTERSRAVAVQHDAMEAHLERGAVLRAQRASEPSLDAGPANLISNTRFESETLCSTARLLGGNGLTARQVTTRRQQAMNCREPLTDEAMAGAVSRSLLPAKSLDELPAWIHSLCQRRQSLATCIIEWQAGTETCSYRFVLASLNPRALLLMPLRGSQRPRAAGSSVATWTSDVLLHNMSEWEYDVRGVWARQCLCGPFGKSRSHYIRSQSLVSQASSYPMTVQHR